jgi:hypothetical protein
MTTSPLFDSPLGAEQSYAGGEDIPLQNISDEEALLACRAFLQRRNKLNGWSLHKTRKMKLQNSLAFGNNRTLSDMRGKMDESMGYFWEDPADLKYMRTGRPRLFFEESIDEFIESSTDDSNENDDLSGFYYSGYEDNQDEEQSDFVSMIDEDDPDGLFTGFPTSPPPDFSARSFSKKRLFQNPEWKKQWYEARWGNLREEREAQKKKKRIEKYIQQIPSDILRSPQLDALTDDEIEDAIKTYIVANRKRSSAQRSRITRKKKILEKSPMERLGEVIEMEEALLLSTKESNGLLNKTDSTLDSFISYLDGYNQSNHFQSLEEDRRRRSERAAKAYQTRLKNSKTHTKETRQKPRYNTVFSSNRNVNASLERIRKALNEQTYPAMDDLKMILKPKRLPGRKNLLQEILLKCFGLRGKCIPSLNLNNCELEEFYSECQPQILEEMEKKFVSTSSIHELAYFVTYNLRLTNITV